MRKILVLRGGALGDFIVTLPTLALLRRQWPESRIELVGNPMAAELGRREGLIDAVHSQHEARWSTLDGGAEINPEFSRWLAEFDLVLSFWPDPEGELGRFFPQRQGQTFLQGAPWPQRAPAAAHYAETLSRLGIAVTAEDRFYRLKRVDVPLRANARQRVAIHPGSGSPRKNWPIVRWQALAEWLAAERETELVFVAGAAEEGVNSVAELARFGSIARDLPLVELAARLGECELFLGHDSGVSHLAAACGVTCVLLFGPTDPAMWAPPTPQVHVIRAGLEMESISVAEVQRVVTAVRRDRR